MLVQKGSGRMHSGLTALCLLLFAKSCCCPSVMLRTCGCRWGLGWGRAGGCHPGAVCPDVVSCCEDSKRSLSARTASSSNCSLPFSARSLLSCTEHDDNKNNQRKQGLHELGKTYACQGGCSMDALQDLLHTHGSQLALLHR